MKTPAQILNDAASTVDYGFTRSAEARTRSGEIVDGRSPDAISWSVDGAILRCSPTQDEYTEAIDHLRGWLEQRCGHRDIRAWSDSFNHGATVARELREAAKYE